jgi:threonine/homoserine/homoserine lactone efflux protein
MEFIFAIIKGIIFGISLAIMTGPSFFALLQTSIQHGFRKGFNFATGIFLSDFICAMIIYWGLFSLIPMPHNKTLISVLGGVILISFGIYTIYRSKHYTIKKNENYDENNSFPPYVYIFKGFFLNTVNPAVYIFWISTDGFANRHFESNLIAIVFLLSILLTVYTTDTIKSYLANKLSTKLESHWIIRINRIAGIILIIIGLYISLEKYIHNI